MRRARYHREGFRRDARTEHEPCLTWAARRVSTSLKMSDTMPTKVDAERENRLFQTYYETCMNRRSRTFFRPATALNDAPACEDRSGAILGLSSVIIAGLLWKMSQMQKAAG